MVGVTGTVCDTRHLLTFESLSYFHLSGSFLPRGPSPVPCVLVYTSGHMPLWGSGGFA